MTWFDWLLIAWWALSTLIVVATVDKPRKPIEPGTAAVIVAINAALIVGLLITRGVL